MTVCDILREGRNAMSRLDLAKGMFHDGRDIANAVDSDTPDQIGVGATKCCMIGALRIGVGSYRYFKTPAYGMAVHALTLALPRSNSVTMFNDRDETTKAECLAVFDSAIAASQCV